MKFGIILAVIVILGFGFYYADQQGWINVQPFNTDVEVDTRTQ